MNLSIDANRIKKALVFTVILIGIVVFSQKYVKAETIITVGPTGTYRKIADAVAVAAPGTTIFVQNGVYTEALKVYNNISIIGESRDGVVLQYPCTNYHNPPLEAYCGIFKNMTIKATADATGIPAVRSYAVHCEKMNSLLGSAIYFENCRFASVGNWDVGMGSCNGFTATFANCLFDNLGIFYHTFGVYAGAPICATLNLNNCTFASKAAVNIRNCFANTSILNVNAVGTLFPTEGVMYVVSSADAVGGPLLDSSFKYSAKNINWNQQ